MRGFLLGCIRQSCYVLLKKGTIYIYDSKKACLNNPQRPRLFFNLLSLKVARNGHYLMLSDQFAQLRLWSECEDEVQSLEGSLNFNKANLDVQQVFPKKFLELNSRIDDRLQW